MNTDEHGLERDELTRRIIGCAYTVSNSLGCGFLEKVYENALIHELRKSGLRVHQQYRIPIEYDGMLVGDYVADLAVEGVVLVELKCCVRFEDIHVAQCLNYLKATGYNVCLLMNFGKPKIEVKRLLSPKIQQLDHEQTRAASPLPQPLSD
jgi:GxxExxY protein